MSLPTDIIYNLALAPAALALAPFYLANYRAKRAGALPARLGLKLPKVEPGGVLIHALSVGETNSAAPLIGELLDRRPNQRLILSAATATGLVQAGELTGPGRAETALQAPLDLLPAVNRFLDRLKPKAVIIVETDIWPNLLRACRLRGIPVVVVNFRISSARHRSHRFLKPFFRSVYGQLAGLTLPSELDRQRFDLLGLSGRVETRVTGSLKYDRPAAKGEARAGLGLEPDRPVIIAGSTHRGEEEQVLTAWRGLRKSLPGLALIMAPRDATRFDKVAGLINARGLEPARLSRGDKFSQERPVILADTLGRLAGLYGLAQAAFVGGSLVNEGGHNPLEPASLGVPVLFGPFMADFSSESTALLAAGGAEQVLDAEQLEKALLALLTRPEEAHKKGLAAQAVFEANNGAAARTVDLIEAVCGWGADHGR